MKVRKATVIDIARDVGVGVATVSRVLNKRAYVSEQTRLAVLKSAGRLNYQPNISARRLVKRHALPRGDARDIAVLLGHGVAATEDFYAQVIQGIEEVLRTRQHNLSLATIGESVLENLELGERIVDRGTRAAVLIGAVEERTVSMVSDKLEAVVLIDATTSVPGVDTVACDNEQGAYDAVCHLLNLGHKRISFIRGPLSHYFATAVNRGYKRALADFKVPYDERLVAEGNFHPDGGYTAMKELLKLSELPTALFSNDEMAMGAIRAIREKGLSIPKDIAVVGFDDIALACHTHPPLTTVCVPKKNMGRIAAKTLFERLKNPAESLPTNMTIPLELVIRESCGGTSMRITPADEP